MPKNEKSNKENVIYQAVMAKSLKKDKAKVGKKSAEFCQRRHKIDDIAEEKALEKETSMFDFG